MIELEFFDLNPLLTAEVEGVKDLLYHSHSQKTISSYQCQWRFFEGFCKEKNLSPLPAHVSTVVRFLLHQHLKGLKASSIQLALAAIRWMHNTRGVDLLGNKIVITNAMRGIRRKDPDRQILSQARPLLESRVQEILSELHEECVGECRDKALLGVMFYAGLRASELCALDISHVQFTDEGMQLTLASSKTSLQEVKLYVKHLPSCKICPVQAMKDWIARLNEQQGPLFRSIRKDGVIGSHRLSYTSLSGIVKSLAGKEFSCHSTRRGMITSLAKKQKNLKEIQTVSRHKSVEMVARYVEEACGYKDWWND